MSRKKIIRFMISTALTAGCISSVEVQTKQSQVFAADDYILPESSEYYLIDQDIEGMDAQELNYARNEIFARYGREFNSEELMDYFESKDWYTPVYSPEEFDSNMLNQYEKENVKFLLSREERLEPGGYQLDQGFADMQTDDWEEEEPETISDEDIEAILDGEVVELGSNISLDLDADGVDEEISIMVDEEYENNGMVYGREYWIEIDGEEVATGTGYIIFGTLYGVSLDGEHIDLIVYDNGPSDDPVSTFLRYEDGELKNIGEIDSFVKNLYVDDGILYGQVRCRVIQTQNRYAKWELNEYEELEEIEEDVYELIDVLSDTYGLEEDIWVADDIDGDEEYLMTPGNVHIPYTDGEEWVYIEYADDIPDDAETEGGWFRTADISYEDLLNTFSGLFMAD